MMRKIRHEVGIFTPEKNKEDKKISPLDDLKMTFSSSLTFNQRRNLKSFLIKLNKDILAPNEKVRSLMQECRNKSHHLRLSSASAVFLRIVPNLEANCDVSACVSHIALVISYSYKDLKL